MNLFTRSAPRAGAPMRFNVLTLPPVKTQYDADRLYVAPRVHNPATGIVTHLDNAAREYPRAVLVGSGGLGKTTALEFIAAHAAARAPVRVQSFADYHVRALPEDYADPAWILLDNAELPAHTAHLQTLAAKYPNAKIWGAARSAAQVPDGFVLLELLPLNEREIVSMVEAWFPQPPKTASRINRPAQDFVASVQAHAGTRELAITPLFLFMLLQVYEPVARPPAPAPTAARVALPMVGGNAAGGNPAGVTAATPFDVPQRTNVSPLPARAAELFDAYLRARLAAESDPEFAARALEGIALSTKRGQLAAQDHLKRGYDLLVERPGGRIEFKHALVQDFLAARALRRNPDFTPMREQSSAPDWREVAIFYAGLGDPSDVVNAALENNDLEFAAAALAAAANPPPALLEQVVKPLATRVWDDNDEHALRALGPLRSNMASDFIAAKLRDRDVQVRERAAYVLGNLHTDRALEYLLPQLRDPSPDVRDRVIAALGTSRSERVIEPLLVALRGDPRVASSDTRLKLAAAHALGEYGTDKAVPALIVDLQVGDPDLREQATVALEKIRSSFAVKPLNEIALKDKKAEVRQAAVRVLNDMQGNSQPKTVSL